MRVRRPAALLPSREVRKLVLSCQPAIFARQRGWFSFDVPSAMGTLPCLAVQGRDSRNAPAQEGPAFSCASWLNCRHNRLR
jgi:hypothetical protein